MGLLRRSLAVLRMMAADLVGFGLGFVVVVVAVVVGGGLGVVGVVGLAVWVHRMLSIGLLALVWTV